MLNQIILVGRLTKEVEMKEEQGKNYAIITLAIPRSFKNNEGNYDTDFIPVLLYKEVATNVKEYCHKGDILGIKGRISNENNLIVIGERVTFLTSNHKQD